MAAPLKIKTQENDNVLHLQHLLNSLQQMNTDADSPELESLFQIDRLIMLGELVNGMAHEIQNPIAGIQVAVQSLARDSNPDDPSHGVYQHIIHTTQRLHSLIHTILVFAKQGEIQFQPVPVNLVVKESVANLQKKHANSLSIQTQLDEILPDIRGNHQMLLLCLMNIMNNAVDAKPQGLELQVTTQLLTRTHNVDMNAYPQLGNPFKCKGSVIQVRVQDNGPGLPSGTIEKVFQPFFTTKEQGSGFGLYFSSQIMRQHRGCIFCSNNNGPGATFTMCLPV